MPSVLPLVLVVQEGDAEPEQEGILHQATRCLGTIIVTPEGREQLLALDATESHGGAAGVLSSLVRLTSHPVPAVSDTAARALVHACAQPHSAAPIFLSLPQGIPRLVEIMNGAPCKLRKIATSQVLQLAVAAANDAAAARNGRASATSSASSSCFSSPRESPSSESSFNRGRSRESSFNTRGGGTNTAPAIFSIAAAAAVAEAAEEARRLNADAAVSDSSESPTRVGRLNAAPLAECIGSLIGLLGCTCDETRIQAVGALCHLSSCELRPGSYMGSRIIHEGGLVRLKQLASGAEDGLKAAAAAALESLAMFLTPNSRRAMGLSASPRDRAPHGEMRRRRSSSSRLAKASSAAPRIVGQGLSPLTSASLAAPRRCRHSSRDGHPTDEAADAHATGSLASLGPESAAQL